MKEFPDSLKVTNKDNFPTLNYKRLKCYLRRDIYEHIISKAEGDYFVLEQFNERVNSMEMTKKLVDEIKVELEALGWKCTYSFGGTGLFIYKDTKPDNCFPDNM